MAPKRAASPLDPMPARKISSFIFILCLALAVFLAFASGVVIGLAVGMSRDRKGGGLSFAAIKAATSLSQGLIQKPTPPPCEPVASTEDLSHDYDDEELFRRAIAVKPAPPTSTHKIAFLFLTRGPLPLAPLWERFFCGHESRFSIYIHTAPDFLYDKSEIPPVFHNRQIPSQEVTWGDVTLVDAERRLLANALLDPLNQRFVLVSESCVPLHDFGKVYDYVVRSEHAFTQVLDDHGPYGRGRWNAGFLPEVPKDEWRKGHQWFEMDRVLAVITVNDTKYYPKFKEHCRGYCYVDEHYMPTMFYILAPERMANRTVTWVDWSRGGFHPATYSMQQLNVKLLRSMRSRKNCTWNGERDHECFLFARKFEEGTLKYLLWAAKRFFGY